MVDLMWFILGGLFGSVATIAYIRSQQLKMMHQMIARMTKNMMEEGDNDGN